VSPPPADRVLVVRLGALGDVVRTRPAFAGVRALYPDARIDWLVDDRAAGGLAGLGGLDGSIELPRRDLRLRRPGPCWRAGRALIARLRAGRYDLAVDFHSVGRSALLTRAAGIPVRVGYAPPLGREGSARLQTHGVPLPEPHVSRFERNAALVRFLGGDVPERAPAPELDEADRVALGDLPRDYFVVHPGTSPQTLYKRWAPESFARVARAVAAETGLRALVAWGPVEGEKETARAVAEAAGNAAEIAPETPSIGALLWLLSGARLFIGGDSGPLHLAGAVHTPAAVVFGPTDPVENAPVPGVPARVIRADVGCNPCREGCPARSCLSAVAPEAVIESALALIAGGERGD